MRLIGFSGNRWKGNWLAGWADIIDGVLSVLTFGLLVSSIAFNLVTYLAKRNYKKRGLK